MRWTCTPSPTRRAPWPAACWRPSRAIQSGRDDVNASQSFPMRALHVGTLWSLAVAQPVLGALAGAPEFLVEHRASAWDIVTITLVLCFLLPANLILVEYVVGR